MTHTTDTAGQEWSDERMGRECAFAAAEYQTANNRFDLGGVKYSYEIVAKRMRDDMAATIATQAARIAELEKQVAWKEGLIRQLTDVDMPAMEADNERLRAELASRQVPDGEVSVPVEMIRICTSYGMPLGITYAEYNAARDKVLAWLNTLKGNE